MNLIGKRILVIPKGVEIKQKENELFFSGPKGKSNLLLHDYINLEMNDGKIKVFTNGKSKFHKQIHGTYNSLILNKIIGVTEGYIKELEINGVGYGAKQVNDKLIVNVGFSHPVTLEVPKDIKIEIIKNKSLKISGIDKQELTQFAAKIVLIKPPEPYGGKGINYKGRYIRRKSSKSTAKS